MDFLIWLVIIAVALTAGFFWIQSVRKRNMAQISQAISREAAQEAAANLDEESRKAIYRNLAKGDVMGAVQNYRALTGASVKDCVIAVRSLEAYPQTGSATEERNVDEDFDALREKLDAQSVETETPQSQPEPAQPQEKPEVSPGENRVDTGQIESLLPADDSWVVPTEWKDKFGSDNQPSATHFKLAYELEGEQHEFSSENLPPNEYDQLFSMLRDGDTEGAAQVLHKHTKLPVEDLERMIATSPMAGAEGSGNVADFRFEGQGPDGPVYFDAADLPEAEREELFEAIAKTDLETMSAIIVRHTSLPQDIVQNMLRSFVKRED